MAVIGPVQLRVMWPISCQNCQRLKDHLRNRGLPNVRFWILNSGISWCRLNDEKILYASAKKIAGPHVFFIQILIIWQKKDEEKGGRGFYISFFYSLNKSNVLRLTEHCWDVNLGQTNCRYWYYSDRSYMAGGKVVSGQSFCVLSLWRYVARSQPFPLQISNWLFLAWTLIRRQKPLVFYHKG